MWHLGGHRVIIRNINYVCTLGTCFLGNLWLKGIGLTLAHLTAFYCSCLIKLLFRKKIDQIYLQSTMYVGFIIKLPTDRVMR